MSEQAKEHMNMCVQSAGLHTIVGKKRVVRNVLNANATVNVPRKRMTDSRKTSGTALVMWSSKHASPVTLQPRCSHSSSVTHCRLTSIVLLASCRQFESSSLTQLSLCTPSTLRYMTKLNIFQKSAITTRGYAMVVHGRPKTPKNTSFWGSPSPRGRTAPIF